MQTCANLTVLKKSLSIQSGSIQPWPSPSVFGPLLLGLFFFYVLLLLRSIETPLLILTVRTTYCDDIPKLHFRTTPTFIFMYFNLLVWTLKLNLFTKYWSFCLNYSFSNTDKIYVPHVICFSCFGSCSVLRSSEVVFDLLHSEYYWLSALAENERGFVSWLK